MVPGQRQDAQGSDPEGLDTISVDDHRRLPGDSVGGQDRHLRLVDDRELEKRAVLARVGDGKGPTDQVVGDEPAVPGTTGHLVDGPGQVTDRQVPHPAHYRRHQALEPEVHSNGQVHVTVHDQLVVADAGVQAGKGGQGLGQSGDDERQIREAGSLGSPPGFLLDHPQAIHGVVVDLHGGQHVRGGGLGSDHVPGRGLPYAVERLSPPGVVTQELLHVSTRQATTEPGPTNPRRIQTILSQKSPHHRRKQTRPGTSSDPRTCPCRRPRPRHIRRS